ncbi:MAG TPA: DUF1611 domain-containing protein [Candidatus Eisenbacteria bacterium]|jgi:uncharacterized NAD-dependent epimerase/dehydratase family protein
MLGKKRRLALLAEARFTPYDAKTAVGVLRYRPEQVAAVIDSTRAGSTAGECVDVGGTIPVVEDVAAAAARGADGLAIGIAPQGGGLPEAWRAAVRDAIARGWDVLSGLHVFLADDPELAAAAAESGARLLDLRRPPARRTVAAARAAHVDALVVLTVGSDCNVGKMTAALELTRALGENGARAAFVATGQTGILIADRGVAVDAVVSDFAAGAVETEVLEAAREAEVVVVEGQGSLHHPGYSGVTLSLLAGSCPRALVLCHAAGRDAIRTAEGAGREIPIPPLRELKRAYESAAAWVRKAEVVGVALNTLGLDERAARAACDSAARELGVPATDPVRFGAGPLARAVLALRGRALAPPA